MIAIAGTGNVAFHLAKAFSATGEEIRIIGRNRQALDEIQKLVPPVRTHTFDDIPDCDIYFLAVKDSAIAEVASHFRGKTLVHTAGSVDMNVLGFYTDRYGVFYPFQTFRKQYDIDWRKVPVFIESCCPQTADMLFDLAARISAPAYLLSSEKRKYLHLAGVLTNNFVNHLLAQTKHILEDHGLEYGWVFPLLEKTTDNAKKYDPAAIQTGPAVRGDKNVMNQHLQMIDDPYLKKVYKVLSESIEHFSKNK